MRCGNLKDNIFLCYWQLGYHKNRHKQHHQLRDSIHVMLPNISLFLFCDISNVHFLIPLQKNPLKLFVVLYNDNFIFKLSRSNILLMILQQKKPSCNSGFIPTCDNNLKVSNCILRKYSLSTLPWFQLLWN
jgi:hypothetical protein